MWLLSPWTIMSVVVIFAASFGWHFAENYKTMAHTITEQAKQIKLHENREASFRRQVDRRTCAIKKSRCSAQIMEWVAKPHTMPQDFRPFDQLDSSKQDQVCGNI